MMFDKKPFIRLGGVVRGEVGGDQEELAVER